MNQELRKRLTDETDRHMNDIRHDTLGGAVEELQRLHPECEITTLPMRTSGGIVVGYRFRIMLRDGSDDSGSFTVPADPRGIYGLTL